MEKSTIENQRGGIKSRKDPKWATHPSQIIIVCMDRSRFGYDPVTEGFTKKLNNKKI